MTSAAVLACLCWAQPALATSRPPAPNPPGGSGPFVHSVLSDVTVAGDVTPGSGASGGAYDSTYVPAQCWLEPRFSSTQSWRRGDPVSYHDFQFDADTYWWSFAQNEASTLFALAHIPNSHQQVNQTFQQYQKSGKAGWWWVPAWLDDPQGLACAKGLVSSAQLNNGYLDFAPPQTGGPGAPGHTINGQILSQLARAALRLPSIAVHTSPAPGKGDVNLPVWVWVTYQGHEQPQDMASVPLPGGGTLWAKVTTSRPTVTVSVSDPAHADVYDNCGATGSRYTPAQAGAVPSCGATFLAPSVGGPYTLTVTARWQVTWTDSTGASGGFPSPPSPPSQVSRSVSVSVREIQSVNGGG